MNKKIAKTLGTLLLLTAVAVTQVPVSDVEAVASASDFQMDGNKLMKYSGTSEVVSIPDDVREIGEEAFAGNDNIIKVNIGGKVKSIGYRAFADCDSLRTIAVGDSVEEIGTAAFSNNKELANVSLGTQVRKVGNGVFAGCSQLADLSVSAGNTFLMYSNGVLYDSEQTKVYALMPACERGAYTLPGTVTEIAGYAFWGNPYLEKVTLGSGLNEVSAYAFSNCINLKEVDIPLTVRGIGAKAFEDCVNLSSVILPDSMAVINSTAFDGCPNVNFTATPGTYGAEFAAALQKSEVEEVEYEDVQDAEVVDADKISNEAGIGDADTDNTMQPDAGADTTPTPDTDLNTNAGQEATPSPGLVTETEIINNKTLLGESSIVSGRAVVFIDNRQSSVLSGGQQTGRIDLSNIGNGAAETEQSNISQMSEGENFGSLLADNAQKGKDFPKYTVVDGTKIASQAFYQNSELSEYTIDEGITEIGEFAFARSGLTSVTIPEGVTKIGYGAFYHCDKLSEVILPDSVTEIDLYAFDQTPWVTDMKTATYPYLIAGDGILIAYAGNDSVINIPDGVKQIGPGVFKEHMGIIAVNIPDTVEIICEEAFMNCRNLKTVNGGRSLVKVKDRAFMNCPLSQVVIPASMQEVGLGAYALVNGTDTVVFEGSILPRLSMESSAMRLANQTYRTYAFSNIRNAIIPDDVSDFEGTVLEEGTYGYNGIIVTQSGTQTADYRSGVLKEEGSGVILDLDSSNIKDTDNAMAAIAGNSDVYVLKITDSESAAERISAAYGELYGGRTPAGLKAYDMSLYDDSGTVPITKLGRQYITVRFKLPADTGADNLHVVTLDQDGQLEALEHRIIELENEVYVQFTTSHFSPLGIYSYSGVNGQAVVTNGQAVITSLSGNKDDTPDTGDFIHPKWFLALGLCAGAIALFFYQGKRGRKIK